MACTIISSEQRLAHTTARATPTQDRIYTSNVQATKCQGMRVWDRRPGKLLRLDPGHAQTSQAAAQAGKRSCAQAKRHTTHRACTQLMGCVVDRASDQTKKVLKNEAHSTRRVDLGGPSMERSSKRSHRLHAAIKSSQGGQQTPSTRLRTTCAPQQAHLRSRRAKDAKCMQMTQSVGQAADPQKLT